jgi:hypothetical protein
MAASGVDTFEQMAVQYLWDWTGRSFGLCELTVRPCRQDCVEGRSTFNGSGPFPSPFNGIGIGGSPWTPVIINGLWYNIGCGRCGDKCGCGGEAPLRLPGPIDSVTTILESGEELDEAFYYVDNRSLVVRTDGKRWDSCKLEITYIRGNTVPIGGQVAAGVLAVELAKAACRDSTCMLPQRIQTITRQGVTIAMLDAFDDVDKGHTGIWIIDSWMASVTKPPIQSRVLSPDVPRRSPRRKTWP